MNGLEEKLTQMLTENTTKKIKAFAAPSRMNKKYLALFSAVFLAVVFAGCGDTVKYKYGNETFSSADKALTKQTAQISEIIDAINPTTTPVHGKVLVAIPSMEELRKHYIRTTGDLSLIRKEQYDYTCATMENEQDMLTKVIQKKGLFDQVTTTRVTDPAATAIGDNDFLIYRDIDGWFIKNSKSAPKKIVTDTNRALGLPRTQSFLESVEEKARSLF
jgi:hypothetical protein